MRYNLGVATFSGGKASHQRLPLLSTMTSTLMRCDMNQFYTYFHTRNDTGAVFYVGKGKGDRAYDNLRNIFWKRVSQKHGHTVHIAANWSTDEEAIQHERFLIQCFRDLGCPLTNLTDGGEGVSGFKHTAESKARLIACLVGRVMSPESRKKISLTLTGRKLSQETKNKLRANKLSYWKNKKALVNEE